MSGIKQCISVSILLFLLSCATLPPATSIVATPLPSATGDSVPTHTASPSPTIVPTSTTSPYIQKALTGIDAFLSPGSQPLYNQAWMRSGTGDFSSSFLPYITADGGMSLLVIASPHEQNDTSTAQAPIRIWDWQDTDLQPKAWQEILPMDVGDSRGLSSFLGRDQNGQWWAVMSTIDWNVPELVLLGVFPIVSHGDVQIEPVSLSPLEENADPTQFLLRTNERLILYEVKEDGPSELWSTDRVMSGWFHVHSYADSGGSVDMTGDGDQELLIVWDVNSPPLVDAYQYVKDGADVLHWLGRLDRSLQYTDINRDDIAEFLRPDNAEKPTEWQVIAWNGGTFEAAQTLSRPEHVSPLPIVVTNLDDLPRLSSDIVFQNRGNLQDWWRWSQSGGAPEKMSQPPKHLYDNCSPQMYGGYGDACFSPAGRYKLIDMPAGIEGSYTGILDGITGNKTAIPGSFVYTQGYPTFAWSPDEMFLLFAQGDGRAKLSKVDPVSGGQHTLFDYSLCGIDSLDCQYISADAITDPAAFEDGGLGFAVQSFSPALYPPPGIYRWSSGGELTLLAVLPYIDESKGSRENLHSSALYGHLLWSPDKSMFLFYDLFVGNKSGMRTLLLGRSDGSALWDLREALPDIYEFRWD